MHFYAVFFENRLHKKVLWGIIHSVDKGVTESADFVTPFLFMRSCIRRGWKNGRYD
jgi:hypothetical protein